MLKNIQSMLWLQKTTHLETCHLQTCHLQPYRCKHVLMIQKVKKFHLFKDIDDAACRQSIVKILHSYMCISLSESPNCTLQTYQNK